MIQTQHGGRRLFGSLVFVLGFAVTFAHVPKAHAFNLTGTWAVATGDDVVRCKNFDGDRSSAGDALFSPLEVTQIGNVVSMRIVTGFGSYEQNFTGIAQNDVKDANKGQAVATACAIAGKEIVGTISLTRIDVSKNMITVEFRGKRNIAIVSCRGKFVRVGYTDPGLVACP